MALPEGEIKQAFQTRCMGIAYTDFRFHFQPFRRIFRSTKKNK